MSAADEPSAQDVLRDVQFDFDENEGGETGFLTVSSPEVLVQLAMLPSDLRRLADIPNTSWVERRTVQAGSCAEVPVHWHAGEPPTAAFISVGVDPETAPIGIVLTEASLQSLLALAASLSE